MSKINELNEKLIIVLEEKIKLLEDQIEISKKIAKIQEEQLIIADVSNNEACEVDLDVVVNVPNDRATTYTLKKKDSEVAVKFKDFIDKQ